MAVVVRTPGPPPPPPPSGRSSALSHARNYSGSQPYLRDQYLSDAILPNKSAVEIVKWPEQGANTA